MKVLQHYLKPNNNYSIILRLYRLKKKLSRLDRVSKVNDHHFFYHELLLMAHSHSIICLLYSFRDNIISAKIFNPW